MVTDPAKLIETIALAQDLRVQRLKVDPGGAWEVEFFPPVGPPAPPVPQASREERQQQQLDEDLAATEGGG